MSRDRRWLASAFSAIAVSTLAGVAATAVTGGIALPALLASGGIMAAGQVAVKAIDEMAIQLDRNVTSRALRSAIEGAVTTSVRSFPREVQDQAIDLAAKAVATRGLSADDMARISFDPAQAARQVVTASAAQDPGWRGGEAVYAAAEAAIRATYEVLSESFLAGPTVQQDLVDLRNELLSQLDDVQRRSAEHDVLISGLSQPAGALDAVLKWPPTSVVDLDLAGPVGPRLGSWLTDGKLPNFASRDIDPQLDNRIIEAGAAGGFVVVSGAPKSGKTRTVLEALLRVAPERVVWALLPSAGKSVTDGRPIDPIAQATWQIRAGHYDAGKLVILLDDLQAFLQDGPDQLTDSRLRSLTDLGGLVVATIHSEALSRIRNHQQGNAGSRLRIGESGNWLAGEDPSLMARITDCEVLLPSSFSDAEVASIPQDVATAAIARQISVDHLRRLPEVLAAVDKMKTVVAEAQHDTSSPQNLTVLRAGFGASATYPKGATVEQLRTLYGWANTRPIDEFEKALTWATTPIGGPDSPHALITRAELPDRWRLFEAISTYLNTQDDWDLEWLNAHLEELEPHASLALGGHHHLVGNLDIARRAFRVTIESRSASAASVAAVQLVSVEADAGDLAAATAAYEMAKELSASEATAAAGLLVGLMNGQEGNVVEARATLRAVANSSPARIAGMAALYLGRLEQDQGNASASRAAWALAISAGDPDSAPEAAFDLGELELSQGMLKEARAAYRHAIDFNHKEFSPLAAIHLGIIEADAGNLRAARAAFQVAIDSNHEGCARLARIHLGVLEARAAIWRQTGEDRTAASEDTDRSGRRSRP